MDMKTAISIPNPLFKIADKTAREMGVPRSRLFSMALEEFVQHHSRDAITKKLNEIYGGRDESGPTVTEAGLESLRRATRHDAW
jgi:hypothetical protein